MDVMNFVHSITLHLSNVKVNVKVSAKKRGQNSDPQPHG